MSEVVIQWKGLPEEEATWEGEHEIQRLYPHFDLEDKVNFNRGGIDTNNKIMGPKNKNSQTKRSTRMGQRPKWLELYMLKGRRRDRMWNVSSSPLFCY